MANIVRFSELDLIKAGSINYIKESLPPGTIALDRVDDPYTRDIILLVEYDFEWCLNRVNNDFNRLEPEEDCGQDLLVEL